MKKYSILPLLVLILAGCSDFLEPQSQTEYVPETVEALNELLIGEAYLDPTKASFAFFSYNEILSDDWGCTDEIGNSTTNENYYTAYKPLYAWHPDMFRLLNENGYYLNVWKNTYEAILGCNAVLDYLEDMTGTTEEKLYVQGQALALRAFYYFQLVNLFGEPYNYNKEALGVPLKLDSNMDLDYPTRATVAEVYAQLVADLDDAEADFSELPENEQFVQGGRVTLPMIQLFRARVALFMEDYDTVISYSNKVINDWGLSLLDLNSFTPSTSEPYYPFPTWDNPEAVWLLGNSTDAARFSSAVIYISTSTTRKMFNASSSLLESYENDDLRKDNYIVQESASISNYTARGKLCVGGDYVDESSEFGRALRLSEAYLMLAEASYMKSDYTTAINALETLRQNRYDSTDEDAYKVPDESTSGEALFSFIKLERRREMCFEGLRWFDLRRWGMESFSRDWKEEGEVVATFTMEKNDPAYTLPIPYDAIERNPNLEQNTLSTAKY